MPEASSSHVSSGTSASIEILPAALSIGREAIHLILIEPDLPFLPDRTQILTGSEYRVSTIRDVHELFALGTRESFNLAVISELLGFAALESATRFVRAQWPEARILLLGGAQRALEDHLYDERIEASCTPNELLKLLAMLYQKRGGGRPFIVPTILASSSLSQATSVGEQVSFIKSR
jgi:hypothetical protein